MWENREEDMVFKTAGNFKIETIHCSLLQHYAVSCMFPLFKVKQPRHINNVHNLLIKIYSDTNRSHTKSMLVDKCARIYSVRDFSICLCLSD